MLHTDALSSNSERIITPTSFSKQEEQLERALRPQSLRDYIGQTKSKQQLNEYLHY